MKSVFFLVCIFCAKVIQAQNGFCSQLYHHSQHSTTRFYRMRDAIERDTFVSNHKIQTVQLKYGDRKFNGKTKYTKSVHTTYDSHGFPIMDQYYNKGKREEYVMREVNAKGNVLHLKYYIGKKLAFEYFNYLNSNGMTEFYYKYRLGKPQYAYRYKYDSLNRVSIYYFYEKDTSQYKNYTEYFYTSDTGGLAHVMRYDAKGKITHSWDYTCESTSKEKRSERKRETRICESKIELPNGHRQEIWMKQEIGSVLRWITEYDSANRPVVQEYFIGKTGNRRYSITTWSYEDSMATKRFLVYNGRDQIFPDFEHIYYYDGNGQETNQIMNTFNNKGKTINTLEYKYVYRDSVLVNVIEENLKNPRKGQWITELEYSPFPAP